MGDISLSDDGWLGAAIVLFGLLVPLVFLPRGKIFERALADARERGEVTRALTAAFDDPFVAIARNIELAIVGVIIGLMVSKPC